jgi:hypothetical protein
MDANRPFDTVFLEARTAITERLLDPSARAS